MQTTQLTKLEFNLFQYLCKIDNKISKSSPQKILLNILVSGGQDSMCLLYAMSTVLNSKLFAPRSSFSMILTHFNHGKRGAESDEDVYFVLQSCLRLGVECFALNIAQKNSANNNFQNFAREERRVLSTQLCTTLCENGGFDDFYVLTAHHAQDHVESVIMHLVRGAGIVGLQGFYAQNESHFLKPFAEVHLNEIKEYGASKNIAFRTDSSNLSDDYDRNFVRHHIIPQFQKINPQAQKNILRFSKKLKIINDVLHTDKKQNEKRQPQPQRLSLHSFILLPTTTSTDLYFFLKKQDYEHNHDISENALLNILKEADVLRQSGAQTKTIPLKNNKKLTVAKIHSSKTEILLSI